MTTPHYDKNGHAIDKDGKLVFDQKCRGCDAPKTHHDNWEQSVDEFSEQTDARGYILRPEYKDELKALIRSTLSTYKSELREKIKGMKLLEAAFDSETLMWKQRINARLDAVINLLDN